MAINLEPQRIIAKAKQLFPEYFELQGLLLKLCRLQWERGQIAGAKYHGSNAYVLKVVETNQLRCILLDFENEQGKRVEDIVRKHQDAGIRADEARRAKSANAVKKGMPIEEEYSFMKWEVDTDIGDAKEPKDAFDQAIAKAEEEIEELSDRFTYEAMLHNTLVDKMKKFCSVAKLPRHEASLWVPKNGDKKAYQAFRDIEKYDLKKCREDAFAWMKAAAVHFLEHEGTTSLMVSGNAGGSYDEGVTYNDQGGGNDNGHDEAGAYPQPRTNWEHKYCNFCQKWGHVDEYCPRMFPEEDQPNHCDVCDKAGHREDKCWVLHPELRKQWLC